MPIEVHRKRTKGYKLPDNTVSVTRPGKWGNPFILKEDGIYVDCRYRDAGYVFLCSGDIELVLDLYRIVLTNKIGKLNIEIKGQRMADLLYWTEYFLKLDVKELKGKNLACFCPVGKPCHRQILLEEANK